MSNPTNEYGKVIITAQNAGQFPESQPGTEIWLNDKWSECLWPLWKGYIYRRAIQPGEGFEIVAENTWTNGQEVSYEYTKDGLYWYTCGRAYAPAVVLAYRRPIKQPVKPPVEPSPWREIGDLEGLPLTGSVETGGYRNGQQSTSYESVQAVRNGNVFDYITHWRLISPIPKPPKVMTESEALTAAINADPINSLAILFGWNRHKAFVERGGK